MTQPLHPRERETDPGATRGAVTRPGPLGRDLPGTGMPARLLLVLVTLGLPRTVLTDLGIVRPEGSWIYYVLALAPFAVWLAVAVFRRTASPIRDHLLAGAVYGLSLFVVHVALGAERSIPATLGIALLIGVGVGLVAGLAGTAARYARARPPGGRAV